MTANTGTALKSQADEKPKAGISGYRPELDAVRSVAFLLVFAGHFLVLTPGNPPTRLLEHVAGAAGLAIADAVRDICGDGLFLFFALSAYLITGLLEAERDKAGVVSVRRFYVRRVLRIWPLYFVGIGIGIALALLLHRKQDAIGFTWYLLFAGNIYNVLYPPPQNPMLPLWSISVEEQFYLVWPWAMRWLTRRWLWVPAALFWLAGAAQLAVFAHVHADLGSAVWGNTLVQFQMFAAGIVLALMHRKTPPRSTARGTSLIIAAFALWFIASGPLHVHPPAGAATASNSLKLIAGYTLIAIGCMAVLHGACMVKTCHLPRLAVQLGKISYGMYVFHVLVLEVVIALFDPGNGWLQWIVSAMLSLALTALAASASYRWLESPFLRLKQRFELLHTRPV